MSSSPGAYRKGKKKALLIAVERVKGISGALLQPHSDAQEFRELLISNYDYAEEDIVVLSHHSNIDMSFWPSKYHIINKVKWLVDDVREHDRLVFYYSGYGGLVEDGEDKVIYGYTGNRIIDNDLKTLLVNPVLKTKGCQLFAMFDCSHSEDFLGDHFIFTAIPENIILLIYTGLKHRNCCSRLLPGVRSSTSGHTGVVDVTGDPTAFLQDLPERTSPSVHGTAQLAPVRPRVSVNTAVDSQPVSMMPPYRTITSSPISIFPNLRNFPICNHNCVATEEEDNEGLVVCISGPRCDDTETGTTLTKFLPSPLTMNASISYKELLDDMQSQATEFHARRAAYMQGQTLHLSLHPRQLFPLRPRRQEEIISESYLYLTLKLQD